MAPSWAKPSAAAPGLDVFWRLRPAEQEPLHDAAAQSVQHLHLTEVFHAFGDDTKVQRSRQRDDGGDDCRALRRHAEIADEAAVDLQFTDRQRGQISERRIAGAEVVDRDFDTDLVEAMQRRDHVLQVLHEARLGDLEFDRVVRHAVGGDGVVDVFDQVGALEQAVRQVDGDRIGEAEAVLPDAACRAASRMAHSLSGVMRPVSSASGMKSPAARARRDGASASALRRPPCARRARRPWVGSEAPVRSARSPCAARSRVRASRGPGPTGSGDRASPSCGPTTSPSTSRRRSCAAGRRRCRRRAGRARCRRSPSRSIPAAPP